MLAVASPASAFIGDVSGDDRVDTLDARLIAGFLVGTSTSVPRPENADVNNDGLITTADALLIMQVSKGLRTSFASNALEVLAVMPSSGTTGVQLTANFSVFFSEPVLSGSLSGITLTDTVTSLPVAGSFTPSQDGVIATFVPAQPFSPNRLYRINVTTAVKDNGGHALVQPFQSTFQTQVLGTGILVSTNNLAAPINELAPQPVVFRALSSLGFPVKQVPVTFTARMGSGVFEPSKSRQIVVLTDDAGFARGDFRLGGEAVLNTVEINAVGFTAVPLYSARALALPAANLRIYSGNSQNGTPGGTTPLPLIVQATDAGGNSISGTTVTFLTTLGQGNFGGQPTANVVTDSSGTASTLFTFGATSGPINVQARFPDMTGQSPTFDLLNLLPIPSSPTLIVGRVIDAHTLSPLNHVYVYAADNPSVWDWTDEDGIFRLPVSPGPHVIDVDGFESGFIDGHLYPVVAIPVNAVQGQENEISMPVLLPRMENQTYIDVSDVQGGTLTLASNPLWKLYVAPGQVRFANGTHTGRLYAAAVPSDKIPMPVAGGKSSRFFDTIQPLNVSFDPPAQVTFPNADNLAPGTVTDIFTLSYTSGTFLKTGRGQVSENGVTIVSLPGEGITLGGWHLSPPPAPPPTTCISGLVVDADGFPVMGCSATFAGLSGVTDGNGVYELCNIPANDPVSPVISCPVSPQCPKDSDGDGFCDEFERRNAPKPIPPPPAPPPDKNPDDTPNVELLVMPEEAFVRPGEPLNLYAQVFVDGEPTSGQQVSIESDNPGFANPSRSSIGTAHAATLAVVILEGAVVCGQNQVCRQAALRALVQSAVATGLLVEALTQVKEQPKLRDEYVIDTTIAIRAVSDCVIPGTRGQRTFPVIKAFITANRLRQNMFFPAELLFELERRQLLVGGVCTDKEFTNTMEKIAALQEVGISVEQHPIGTSLKASEIALIQAQVNEKYGAMKLGGWLPLNTGPEDQHFAAHAILTLRRLATNDAALLRLDSLRAVPGYGALPVNPDGYPDTITAKFVSSGMTSPP